MTAPTHYFPAPRRANFCSQCGSPIRHRVPEGDNRERDVCDHCGAIHYQNPRMVVGTVPVWQGRILLCRRAIEPRYDTWTLPAGFMELGESTAQGAGRETLEESGARIRLGQLYTIIDVPQIEQVHLFYLAEVLGPELDPGPRAWRPASSTKPRSPGMTWPSAPSPPRWNAICGTAAAAAFRRITTR